MKAIYAIIAGLGFSSLGCASAIVPPELASARTTYERASKGIAASLNPTDLHTAKKSLDTAEQSFARDGNTQITRDLGYTAGRRAETAEVHARTMKTSADKEAVVADMHAKTAMQAKLTSAELADANKTIASKDRSLASETKRREEAEKRAQQAAADLAKLASVKQEARGMVVTLSGGVLFVSAKAELLPTAQVKLNEIAKALIEQDPDSTMIIEGHTDSQGTVASNQELSQKRADAVRDYLVSRGVAADRITAKGMASTMPLAPNTSAEGRSNNRRVEIIIKRKS